MESPAGPHVRAGRGPLVTRAATGGIQQHDTRTEESTRQLAEVRMSSRKLQSGCSRPSAHVQGRRGRRPRRLPATSCAPRSCTPAPVAPQHPRHAERRAAAPPTGGHPAAQRRPPTGPPSPRPLQSLRDQASRIAIINLIIYEEMKLRIQLRVDQWRKAGRNLEAAEQRTARLRCAQQSSMAVSRARKGL